MVPYSQSLSHGRMFCIDTPGWISVCSVHMYSFGSSLIELHLIAARACRNTSDARLRVFVCLLAVHRFLG